MLNFLLALSVVAQPAPAPANPNLEPLAFLVGSCWHGTFPIAPVHPPRRAQTDTHCFTAMFGGAFIRDVHVVDGAPQSYSGETIYRWDAGERRIRFDYYASDGAHTAGVALPVASGLSFPETRRTAAGADIRIETSWSRDGADAYLVRSAIVEGENRRELLNMRMVRVGPATAPR